MKTKQWRISKLPDVKFFFYITFNYHKIFSFFSLLQKLIDIQNMHGKINK